MVDASSRLRDAWPNELLVIHDLMIVVACTWGRIHNQQSSLTHAS